MADTAQVPVNGTFPAQHAYPDSYSHVPAPMNSAANFQPAPSSTPSNAPVPDQKNSISKDEVGWYFVEQYYTNMSRSPEKLHLFYSRRSQLVFGTEAESVPVAVGQKAINDKIKQLDFQECKVRVLNVDSQASFDNILVSVIGEISNKSEPSRKFVQTFVLAEQPNGYYVLNDIFRYLVEEEEEVVNEESAPAPAPAPAAPAEKPAVEAVAPAAEEAGPAAVDDTPASEDAVAAVQAEEKVEEKVEKPEENGAEVQPEAPAPQTNGAQAEAATEVAKPTEPEVVQPEKPATPEPTPEPTQAPVQEAAAPAKENVPPARAVPKTWANIASKITGAAAPVVPAVPAAPAAPAAPAKPAAAAAPAAPAAPAAAAAPTAPASGSAPAPAAAPAAAPESTPAQPSTDSAGWQTAGHDHKKTQSRAGEEQGVQAYVKNVTDKVDASLLRQALSRFGKLNHFDVSRTKNCAFVEFADAAAYAAATAANPHQIGTEKIYVEERRPRASAYGNANYGAGRGGAGRGRGDRAGSQGRGGFQRDGRGGFAPRGRGGHAHAKSRNQSQGA